MVAERVHGSKAAGQRPGPCRDGQQPSLPAEEGGIGTARKAKPGASRAEMLLGAGGATAPACGGGRLHCPGAVAGALAPLAPREVRDGQALRPAVTRTRFETSPALRRPQWSGLSAQQVRPAARTTPKTFGLRPRQVFLRGEYPSAAKWLYEKRLAESRPPRYHGSYHALSRAVESPRVGRHRHACKEGAEAGRWLCSGIRRTGRSFWRRLGGTMASCSSSSGVVQRRAG